MIEDINSQNALYGEIETPLYPWISAPVGFDV